VSYYFAKPSRLLRSAGVRGNPMLIDQAVRIASELRCTLGQI